MKHFGNISAVAMATKQNLHNHSCNIWYSKNIYSYRRKKSDLIEKGLRLAPFWAEKVGITLALSLGNYCGPFRPFVGIYHGPRQIRLSS